MITPTIPQLELKRPKRKVLFRVLWSLVAVVAGVCLFWTYSYYTALWERDALIAELRAKGEPVWWKEILARLKSQHTDETGAKLLHEAMWEAGWPFNPAKPQIHSARLEALRDLHPEPVVLPEVQQALRAADRALSLAEQAVQRKQGFLMKDSLGAESPFIGMNIDGIQSLSNLVRMLRWRAFDALARGDAETAYRSACLSFAIAQQLNQEPLLCFQVVRIAYCLAACEQLLLCVGHASAPDEEFHRLDAQMAFVEETLTFQSALIGERAFRLAVLGNSEEFRRELADWNAAAIRQGAKITWVHRHWIDIVASTAGLPARIRTQSALIRMMEEYRRAMGQGPADQSVVDELCAGFKRLSPIHRLVEGAGEFSIDFLQDFPKRVRSAHCRLILARLALRLRRHFDRHGRLTETLNELCDATMPKIRLEWFQNQPIVYKPRANGFRLELPESIVSSEARYLLSESPILSDFGLEVEFKTVKQGSSK